MKRSELADWVGKEIVVQAPNDRYHGADYGIVDDLTTYTESNRFSRSGSHHPDPKGKFYRVRFTGCYYSRHSATRGHKYVPLSHLRAESADDHQARYKQEQAASAAAKERREREQAAAENRAVLLVRVLGIGSVEHSRFTGTPRIVLTLDEAERLATGEHRIGVQG